jgi:poly-gamma-glutamate synthesis protein (capsule biosynthesis protein)
LVWEPAYEEVNETPGTVTGSEAIDTPTVSGTRLLFVGDIMLDRNVATRSRAAGSLAYPFQRLPVGWFEGFDLAIGNLEGPVTDQRRPPEKSIDFQFDPAVIPILKAQGIDAVSQANNHTLDQGRLGSDDSRARLQASGLLVFGDQVRDDGIALATTTVNGIRFAFVGFNTTDNPLDREAASTTLALAEQNADQVIVFMHWGNEYKDRPDPSTVETAHWLIDHGTDVVIGAHPHWVQGFSVYKEKPIAWSLGNFIFDQDWSAETRQGLALAVSFKGKTIELEPIPLQIDLSQPRLVEGEVKVHRLERLAEISDGPLREQVLRGSIRF